MNIKKSDLKIIAKKAMNLKKDSGVIEYYKRKYSYQKDKVSSSSVEDIEKETADESKQEELYTTITFVDVTQSKKIRSDLLLVLIVVGSVMLTIIYFISSFFAKRSIKPIQKSWERQNQFIEDASHEFKTPLAVIQANTDVLLDNPNETIKSQEKWIEYIQYEINRANLLIKDLLEARKEENISNIDKKKINYSKMLENLVSSMKAISYEKNTEIILNIKANIYIEIDENKLKQCLFILIDNAIKYSEDNSNIEIQLYEKGKKKIFEITNKCNNLAVLDEEKIFDRFYRGDSSRKHDTSSYGLGLSIAKAIIERLKGKINVIKKEKEITFLIEL